MKIVKFKCDKCGKDFKNDEVIEKFGEMLPIGLVHQSKDVRYHIRYFSYETNMWDNFDICPDCYEQLQNILKEEDIGDFSDGFHTFNDLYHQRAMLFATICNTYKDLAWKSHRHSDGDKCFGKDGWFIVGIETPDGQYTYHYKDEYWDIFKVKEIDKAPEWDGHTDKDVNRLFSLIKAERS